MRFGVLGPLEVEADQGPVVVGGQKERLLLALLLTRPNRVVPVEALIRGLWGEHPPPTAAKTLQSHVMRLRRVLEPGRGRGAAGQVLVTRDPGYLLQVAAGALDAARFEELTAAGRRLLLAGQADTAGSMLRQALGLWRGQAFEEFLDSDFGAAEAERLGELRLVAVEDRLEADLRLGRHRELVAELEGLVREQPLRERLWAQLLLALYRSGRQADALLAYQRARSVLVEELGIDPGTELRRLHAAILAQDPGLDLPASTESGPVQELPEALVPGGRVFAGRAAELAWLREAWTRAAHGQGRTVFLTGGQGMGKTRLAAELAQEVHHQGGWVLYGRCEPAPADPLQPFQQPLAGAGMSVRDVPGAGRSPSAVGQGLADLLGGRTDAGVLLVVDDLHLAQPPALEALAALVAAAATRRLLVLGAYRQEAVTPGLAALVQRLDPGGAACRRLGPFDHDEVAQILALYQSEHASRAAAGAVLEATGGVPLLVHQAARDWAHTAAERQVEQGARQTASSRSHLRLVQARLADDVVDLRELGTSQDQPGEGEAEDQPAVVVCPYKGLARFEPGDAAFFFGRERLVAELVTHLVGVGLVGVVGPSGSGKSSLVRAGLLPALAEGVLPGSDGWRQVLMRPGEHPMRELGLALGTDEVRTAATADGDGEAPTSTQDGTAGPVLGRAAGNLILKAASGTRQRLLLVVDQFEEVFTTCRDEAERARFLAALTEAAQATDGQLTVVVAVRADYYGHCTADSRLASLLATNHVLVSAMDAGELRRAIELPARRAGLRLESGLAEAMVGEVAEEPGGLPLLSCALLESWQHRRGPTLTLAAYQQAGGVHGAVARLAEHAWRQLDADQQTVARRVLLRLAGPGEGEAVVRRRVPLSEFTQGPDQRGRAVLDALTDQRLLTKSHDSVEVAHEALLREWPRLRGWLEEDVQGRALHRHLIGAAQEWAAGGRDPGELYRGARLTGALDWARDHDGDLNQLEREFLDASRAAAEREVADAQRRAEREARTSRRLRGLLTGLAAVLVLALVAGGLALSLRGRAEHQALVADSRHLGAQALLEKELDRSLLLARQAVALDDSVETRGDLLAALLRSPAATAILRGNLDGIGCLELSPKGQLLAVGDVGTVVFFDVRTRRAFPTKVHITGQVADLKFSPDESLLAFPTSELGPAYLWDVRSGRVLHELSPLSTADKKYAVDGIEFSADGHTLTTLSDEGAKNIDFDLVRTDAFLTRWDVASGHRLAGPVRISSHHGGGFLLASPDHKRLVIVTSVEVLVYDAGTFQRLHRFPHRLKLQQSPAAAMDPHGRTLALGYREGRVEFLDLSTGRRRPTNGRHEGIVTSARFSPDGKTLATGGFDRTVKLWDVASGQLRETLQGHEARVAALRFSHDGQTLYSAGSKSVIAWDLEGSHRLGRPFSIRPGSLAALAVSPNGSLAATPDLHDADRVALRSITSPETVRRSLAPRLGPISAVAFSPDGKRLAVGGEHAPTPVLLDVASGAVVQKLTGSSPEAGAYPVSLRFDPTGRRLVAGLTGSPHHPRAIVWHATTGKPIANLPMPDPDDVSVAWSPDGNTVATAGGQGKVILWHTADWAQIATLKIDPLAVLSVAFSPDSSVIAAQGLANRSITLWDVATHKLVGRLPHPSIIHTVVFNPHGKTLATVDDDEVRLWDLASMRQIGPALPGPEQAACPVVFCFNLVAFDPSGDHLIALYPSGTGIVWDVNPTLWERRACAVAGRSPTRDEWRELLPGRRYQPACQ